MSHQPSRLMLASASPRRRALLERLGLAPEIRPSDVPEDGLPGERPQAMVLRLAEAKGRSVAARLGPAESPCVLLAADTAVVLDGRVLGKPSDAVEASHMLRELRGRTHEVLTAVFLLRTDDARAVCEVESSRVRFRDYEDQVIADYVASGEGLDKAGAYGIQGRGATLAAAVEGSFSNVVGLPVERLADWLSRIGVDLERLREAGPRLTNPSA